MKTLPSPFIEKVYFDLFHNNIFEYDVFRMFGF